MKKSKPTPRTLKDTRHSWSKLTLKPVVCPLYQPANQTLIGRPCHAAATDAHLPIAHGAPGANIATPAMVPSLSMLGVE